MNTTINVDAYILLYSGEVAARLQAMRTLILSVAPTATESMSYGMPYYFLNGRLVYFAACKNHIGFYPMPETISMFEKELQEYTYSKGAVQFPHHKPLPMSLIKRMVLARVQANTTHKKK